jgi:hypothetical protein
LKADAAVGRQLAEFPKCWRSLSEPAHNAIQLDDDYFIFVIVVYCNNFVQRANNFRRLFISMGALLDKGTQSQ